MDDSKSAKPADIPRAGITLRKLAEAPPPPKEDKRTNATEKNSRREAFERAKSREFDRISEIRRAMNWLPLEDCSRATLREYRYEPRHYSRPSDPFTLRDPWAIERTVHVDEGMEVDLRYSVTTTVDANTHMGYERLDYDTDAHLETLRREAMCFGGDGRSCVSFPLVVLGNSFILARFREHPSAESVYVVYRTDRREITHVMYRSGRSEAEVWQSLIYHAVQFALPCLPSPPED